MKMKDKKPITEINGDGARNLAATIVLQAVEDYRDALRGLRINPQNREKMKTALECEEFFSGEWIMLLTDIPGATIRDRIRKEFDDYDDK